jgi:hypothetical protein
VPLGQCDWITKGAIHGHIQIKWSKNPLVLENKSYYGSEDMEIFSKTHCVKCSKEPSKCGQRLD